MLKGNHLSEEVIGLALPGNSLFSLRKSNYDKSQTRAMTTVWQMHLKSHLFFSILIFFNPKSMLFETSFHMPEAEC